MSIDYSRYSIEDLHSALASIDREKYPENHRNLLRHIENRMQKENLPAERNVTQAFAIAGTGTRFLAMLIDSLLFLPFAFALLSLRHSPAAFLSFYLGLAILGFVYPLIFHFKYGATLGKRAMGIQVVKDDFSRLDLATSFRRSMVDGILMLLFIFFLVGNFNSLPAASPLGEARDLKAIINNGPQGSIRFLQSLWGRSEILTCLLNKRRKALHDFIAGTLVVSKNA